MNREILHVITRPEKVDASWRGLELEAHPDDSAMDEGSGSMLVKHGVGMTVATFTDGADRQLLGYTPRETRAVRRVESSHAVSLVGAAQVYNADLPDGRLSSYLDEAAVFLDGVIKDNKPQFIIVPHHLDPHPDHAAAAHVAQQMAEVPLYYMDTVPGVEPTHVISVSRRAERQRNRAYNAHASQVTDLPFNQMRDVQNVFEMPRRRGRELGIARAAILVQDERTRKYGDPISDILGEKVIYKR